MLKWCPHDIERQRAEGRPMLQVRHDGVDVWPKRVVISTDRRSGILGVQCLLECGIILADTDRADSALGCRDENLPEW